MRCKDCKFSSPASQEDRGTIMLDCASEKFLRGYRIEKEELSPDCVHVEDDEGWAFTVAPGFGCIHFIHR